MASLVDSIKTVIADSYPFVKITVLAVLIFEVLEMIKDQAFSPEIRIGTFAVAFLILLGFMLSTIHNSINVKDVLMPNLFNPFKLVWVGINGFLALFPFLAIVYFGVEKIRTFLTFDPVVNNVILVLVFTALFSFFVVAMLLYCKEFKMFAGYNLKKIFQYSGDFIYYNFILTLLVALLVGVIFFPIGLCVDLMFGQGKVFDFYITFSTVFVVLCMLQYYAQLYFEYIDLDNTKLDDIV